MTNPPYKHALQFAQKALSEVPYVAFLVRSSFDIEGRQAHGLSCQPSADADMAISEAAADDASVWLDREPGAEQYAALLAYLGARGAA